MVLRSKLDRIAKERGYKVFPRSEKDHNVGAVFAGVNPGIRTHISIANALHTAIAGMDAIPPDDRPLEACYLYGRGKRMGPESSLRKMHTNENGYEDVSEIDGDGIRTLKPLFYLLGNQIPMHLGDAALEERTALVTMDPSELAGLFRSRRELFDNGVNWERFIEERVKQERDGGKIGTIQTSISDSGTVSCDSDSGFVKPASCKYAVMIPTLERYMVLPFTEIFQGVGMTCAQYIRGRQSRSSKQ